MKSSILFVTVALAGSFLVGQGAPQKAPAQPTASSQQGRYQIVFSPHARADTYLLDTQTGRVWRPVQYTDVEGNPLVWVPMMRFDSHDELVKWLMTQPSKPATPDPGK